MSPLGYFFWFLSLKCSLGSGAAVKYFLFIAIRFVLSDAFVTQCLFTVNRNCARCCDPCSRSWLISYTHGNFPLWTRGWCTDGRIPIGYVWRHRDMVFTSGSRTYTVTFRLLVPHLEAFPGYIQSVTELCAVICGSTFALQDPVCRHTYIPCCCNSIVKCSQTGVNAISDGEIANAVKTKSLMKAIFASADVMCMAGMRSSVV